MDFCVYGADAQRIFRVSTIPLPQWLHGYVAKFVPLLSVAYAQAVHGWMVVKGSNHDEPHESPRSFPVAFADSNRDALAGHDEDDNDASRAIANNVV